MDDESIRNGCVLYLHAQGLTVRAIADEVGLSRSQTHRIVTDRAPLTPESQSWRQEFVARIDELRAGGAVLADAVEQAQTEAGRDPVPAA